MKKYNDMKRKVFIAVMSLVVSGGLSGQSVYPGQHSGKLKKENGYNNNKVNDFSAMEAPYSSFTAP